MKLVKFVKLLEDFEDAYKKGSRYVEIYRNPTRKEISDILKDFQEEMLRGILRYDGELFVLSDEEVVHDDIVNALMNHDLLDPYSFWYLEEESTNKFIGVDRQRNGTWKPAESYTFDIPDELFNHYKEEMRKKGYELLQ